jgi:hypothetical protein
LCLSHITIKTGWPQAIARVYFVHLNYPPS